MQDDKLIVKRVGKLLYSNFPIQWDKKFKGQYYTHVIWRFWWLSNDKPVR